MIIAATIDSKDEENGYTESEILTVAKNLEEAGLDLIEISGPNGIRNDENPYFMMKQKKLLKK